ncbi:ABC-type transport auxiliary lipoprotein family protein [Undibacterium sp. Ji22W]|uniref:ABC-type transport auxiliary lipoprotein family protein n=1 Tax=Undibacterium sp. Ji22W TaxID=3413038 RepID=UPI003BEFEC1F
MSTTARHATSIKKIGHTLGACIVIALLSACATTSVQQQYDFGSEMTNSSGVSTENLSAFKIQLAEIQAPVSLESSAMLYRLQYENGQELKPYAQSRWNMPPAQLLKQRIKSQINRLGGAVLASSDGVKALPLLRLELEEFSQQFSTPNQSQVQLRWRASLIKNNQLLGQKEFTAQAATETPDARGGAKAMPQASDRAIMELISWMQTQLK